MELLVGDRKNFLTNLLLRNRRGTVAIETALTFTLAATATSYALLQIGSGISLSFHAVMQALG